MSAPLFRTRQTDRPIAFIENKTKCTDTIKKFELTRITGWAMLATIGPVVSLLTGHVTARTRIPGLTLALARDTVARATCGENVGVNSIKAMIHWNT